MRFEIDLGAQLVAALALLATLKERYRGKPGWPFVELKTGHDAMVSAPEALTRLLLEAA